MSVNFKKTEILYQPVPGQANVSPSFKINGSVLKNVESFSYLGSFISVKADINDEIQHRLRAASYAFGRMRERVFEERHQCEDLQGGGVTLPPLWPGILDHLPATLKNP